MEVKYSNIVSADSTEYDASVIHDLRGTPKRWQRYGLLLVVVILTITSFATLVHRHIGTDDRGCALCHVRHETGADNPIATSVAVPVATERLLEAAQVQTSSRESIPVRSGRAPPTSF